MAPDDLAGQPPRDDLAGEVAVILLAGLHAISSPLERSAMAGKVESALGLIRGEQRTWGHALAMLEGERAELEAEVESLRDGDAGRYGGLW